jgi:hypothetical protein
MTIFTIFASFGDWNLQNHINLRICKSYYKIWLEKRTLGPLHLSVYGIEWHPKECI